ncbi:thioredoxin [Robbsia andropogonis]|uniref:Thioredoxin n=1 Tax=Robbsia andropogonis TaxID=28092 RepID=A0A0F5JU76_9BURK|nr:thioredoxin family protein [Robbsia andropogonis]KKB61398.1 thioredoxin [Robbsia andropogonis]MCP1120903.1 thioredoxin family protein [Robbsia andropogonis]MCP1130723.1 thioredoxin family protein [Robbsia andropogonis]
MTLTPVYAALEPQRAEIDAQAGPALLEFGAPWCPHCQAAQVPLATAFAAHAEMPLRHWKVEDGKGRALGRSFRVTLWPTFIFLRDGKEVSRLVRPTTAAPIHEALTDILRNA